MKFQENEKRFSSFIIILLLLLLKSVIKNTIHIFINTILIPVVIPKF